MTEANGTNKISIEEIQLVVFAYRREPNRLLRAWIDRHGLTWRYANEEFGIDRARNLEVRRFLQEDVAAGRRYLLMLDADMVPWGATDPILIEPGDLLWCPYLGRQGTRGHVDSPGCGCLRVSADVLGRTGPPWFAFGPGEVWLPVRSCECSYFTVKAQGAGFVPRCVGMIGHLQEIVIRPDAESPDGMAFLWPRDLEA